MEKYPGSSKETGSRQLHQPNQPWQLIWGRCWSQILQCEGKARSAPAASQGPGKGRQGPARIRGKAGEDQAVTMGLCVGFVSFLYLPKTSHSPTSDLGGSLESGHLDLMSRSHFSATTSPGRLLCRLIASHTLTPSC